MNSTGQKIASFLVNREVLYWLRISWLKQAGNLLSSLVLFYVWVT